MIEVLQERYDEVERTRLEYNNARQAVGVAHKAAVKLAAKKDATKIEENTGFIQAEAVLTGFERACMHDYTSVGLSKRRHSVGLSGDTLVTHK